MLIKIYNLIIFALLLVGTALNIYALDYGGEQIFKIPIRERSIIVSEGGYYPETISLFQGEKIKIFLTSTLDQPSCLMIPSKKVFMSAKKGEVFESEAYFEKPGIYKFYCPTGKIKGKIVVLPRKDKRKVDRSVASQKGERIWRPQEEY